jgi:hypothetical protein
MLLLLMQRHGYLSTGHPTPSHLSLTPSSSCCCTPLQALERIPYSVSLWKAAIELVDEDDAKVR